MNRAEQAQIIEEIATELADIGQGESSNILFYAEAGPGWMGGSIFFARPNEIVWNSPGQTELAPRVRQLWNTFPSDQKWRGMTLLVEGVKFRTEFDYGEGWSPDEDEGDRRERIVRAYFGDKPIHYPPLEGAELWTDE